MKASELRAIRDQLLQQRCSIMNKTSKMSLIRQAEREVVDDSEAASVDQMNDLSIRLNERDLEQLKQIDLALKKIEGDHYGECESCREAIDLRRLRARPFSRLCIECMEMLERQQSFPLQ